MGLGSSGPTLPGVVGPDARAEVDSAWNQRERRTSLAVRAKTEEAKEEESGSCSAHPDSDDAGIRRFAASRTRATGLEPATSGVTGRRSNQLNYAR